MLYITLFKAEKKTVRLGNSTAVILPAWWMEGVGLSPGDSVILQMEDDRLIVKKKEATPP